MKLLIEKGYKSWWIENGYKDGYRKYLWPDGEIHRTRHDYDSKDEAKKVLDAYNKGQIPKPVELWSVTIVMAEDEKAYVEFVDGQPLVKSIVE
jgi:hypothetical protein